MLLVTFWYSSLSEAPYLSVAWEAALPMESAEKKVRGMKEVWWNHTCELLLRPEVVPPQCSWMLPQILSGLKELSAPEYGLLWEQGKGALTSCLQGANTERWTQGMWREVMYSGNIAYTSFHVGKKWE